MMIKLQKDFQLNKYGLHLRLVNENDAEFILNLRTSPQLSKYINKTTNDTTNQINWLKQYKERENEGLEYYFIYSYNNEYVGLNRIYHRNTELNEAIGGSFVFKQGCLIELPILATLILFDLAFNTLNIDKMLGDIRLGNKKVIKFHEILNVHFTDRDELNQYYDYDRMTFNTVKCKLESLLLPINTL